MRIQQIAKPGLYTFAPNYHIGLYAYTRHYDHRLKCAVGCYIINNRQGFRKLFSNDLFGERIYMTDIIF